MQNTYIWINYLWKTIRHERPWVSLIFHYPHCINIGLNLLNISCRTPEYVYTGWRGHRDMLKPLGGPTQQKTTWKSTYVPRYFQAEASGQDKRGDHGPVHHLDTWMHWVSHSMLSLENTTKAGILELHFSRDCTDKQMSPKHSKPW